MAWQFHPLLLLFVLGGLVSLWIAGFCWRYMQRNGRSYLVLAIGVLGLNNAVWVFAATLKTASADLGTSVLFYKLEFVGLLPNTVVAIVMALAYVGRDRWITRRTVGVLGVVPATFVVLALVNPGQVFIADPTLIPRQGILAFEHAFPPLFWGYLLWVYGTILVTISVIACGMLVGRVPPAPAVTGIIAFLLPLVTGLVKTAGIYPTGGDGINVAPAASALAVSVFAVAIIQYRVFELIPIGRSQAIENIREGYVLVGPDGTIRDLNPAAEGLLGTLSVDGLDGRPVSEVLPRYGDLTDDRLVDLELDGRIVEVRLSGVTRQNQDAGEVLLLHDVTEKRQQQDRLERRNEQLDEFARTVSHDLRNPLQVAKARLSLAQDETDSEEHLAAVENAHDRMEALIDDVLTLARQGDSIDQQETVDLATFVETCWRTVETSDATIVVETEQTIRADRNRLQQLLENLFRNAVEHTETDVCVTVGPLETGFYVADDGAGIPDDDKGQVFDAGYSTGETGTGFGLRIVEQVVDAHGWDIELTDSDDGGARFDITGVVLHES